ncbi:hypothetical protein [Ornithinimicrobium tianjinense]|uniref:Phosphotransferase enzyme family protein n=1 Tax=Ornithinimicrobium tianjinense TaxID=1195761 RepID=A0A917F569_9MICO|nr:hypothetical protein [Ornithinimicrobium tianjinense]GGF49223.1 hypothetical protein GCM10011366_16410 [Ornithinimicrobium tianjinense]
MSTARAVPDQVLPRGVRLGPGTDLGGSARSQVHRHTVLEGPDDWGTSVVVKRFLPQPPGRGAAMGYERERVGLQLLPGAPRLLAADDGTRTVVMEDLGAEPTLADVLLADASPQASATAYWQIVEWAAALGGTVRADPALLAAARDRLGPAVAEDRRARADFPRRGLERLAEVTGSRSAAAARAELLDAVERLERDTARHVLGPGDACPDNAVLTPGGVRFLDLEGAGVRHLAYEAAYAAEPFSTCWCVFRPPAGLTVAMLEAFTSSAEQQLPGLAKDPAWARQVREAVAAWVLSATGWLMDAALEDRGIAPDGRLGPRARPLLASRWRRVAAECRADLPDVARACEEAATWAARTWGTAASELPGYPAFVGDGSGRS